MSNKILSFLGTLFVAVVTVALTYYLSLDKSDVRYTLSEEIPLSFSATDSIGNENVQQLEVRNVGSASAEKIVVKISGEITNYKVVKYISSDAVQAFVEQQPTEFVYPALPPQAGFKIIFISSNVVNASDITVSHSSGQAENALSVSNRSSIYTTWGVYILLLGGYLFWIFNSLRDISFSSWKSELKRKKIEQVLDPSKPWYISDEKWIKDHSALILELLRDEYVPQEKIPSCAAYGILSKEKPKHFSESDWKEINELAIGRLKDHLSKSIDSYLESAILSVIRLDKPDRFPKEEWEIVQKNANEKFIERNKAKIYGKASMVELLRKQRPDGLPVTTWDALHNFTKKRYYEELIYEIEMNRFLETPKNVIDKNVLDVLDAEQQKNLEEHVQEILQYNEYNTIIESFLKGSKTPDKKPNTLKDWEWEKIQRIEELVAQIKDYKLLITSLLKGSEIPVEKPTTLTDWEWDKIKSFEGLVTQINDMKAKEKDLREQERELTQKQSAISSEKENTLKLKENVLKQLEFINKILVDPSSIERVESYDDTFSPGNLRNLKLIADLLMSNMKG